MVTRKGFRSTFRPKTGVNDVRITVWQCQLVSYSSEQCFNFKTIVVLETDHLWNIH